MKNQNRTLEVAFLIFEAKIVLCIKLQFCSNNKSFHKLISWGTKTIYFEQFSGHFVRLGHNS